jgi:hypothetical protein
MIKPKTDGDGHAYATLPGSPTSSGKKIPKVSEKYFGMGLADSQSADEPYDAANRGEKATDGVFKTGRGSQGGGSKPTPQAKRMVTGSGTHKGAKTYMCGSYPKQTQRLRGR